MNASRKVCANCLSTWELLTDIQTPNDCLANSHFFCSDCLKQLPSEFKCQTPDCQHVIQRAELDEKRKICRTPAKLIATDLNCVQCPIHRQRVASVCHDSACKEQLRILCDSCKSQKLHKSCKQPPKTLAEFYLETMPIRESLEDRLIQFAVKLTNVGVNFVNLSQFKQYASEMSERFVWELPSEFFSEKSAIVWVPKANRFVFRNRALAELELCIDSIEKALVKDMPKSAVEKAFDEWTVRGENRPVAQITDQLVSQPSISSKNTIYCQSCFSFSKLPMNELEQLLGLIREMKPGQHSYLGKSQTGKLELRDVSGEPDVHKYQTQVEAQIRELSSELQRVHLALAKMLTLLSEQEVKIEQLTKNSGQTRILEGTRSFVGTHLAIDRPTLPVRQTSTVPKSLTVPQSVAEDNLTPNQQMLHGVQSIPPNPQSYASLPLNSSFNGSSISQLPPVFLPFHESSFLSRNDQQNLRQLIPKLKTARLVYFNYSYDRNTATEFHKTCDRIAGTLTVAKYKNWIAGGFVDKKWEGNGVTKKSDKAFLFSLNRMRVYPILKKSNAIDCHPSLGPSFGCELTS